MTTIRAVAQDDSLYNEKPTEQNVKHKTAFSKVLNAVVGFFSPELDTIYIEPQKYNFTAMAQAQIVSENITFKNGDRNSVSMSPRTQLNFGPYFGWRWLFSGYAFNINALDLSSRKIDINTTIYTPAVGFDIVYKKMGGDYQIMDMEIDGKDVTSQVRGHNVNGLNVDMFSLTGYYLLNAKRYSHQALFNQSNCQKRSAGSWIIGTGYVSNTVYIDGKSFSKDLIGLSDINIGVSDSSSLALKVNYKSIPFTVGYGYNWVIAKNCLIGAQLSGSLSYMWSKGDGNNPRFDQIIEEFNFKNFTFDGTVRVGFVWNTSRWFAGVDAIYHSYHYHENSLRLNNTFGTVNIYVGFNFWRRKR